MRQCAFCWGAPAVRAPALPEWVRECFPDERVATSTVACKCCRSGWMRVIDDEAMPVLKLLVAGWPFVLSQQNQKALAAWSAMTILMFEAAGSPETFSREVYRHVFERRQPPTGFRLALGIRPREGEWPCRFAAQGFRASNGRPGLLPTFSGMTIDTYRAGLCVGHLVIRASARFAPRDAEVLADPIDAATLAIWPPRAPIRWPPPAGLVRMQAFDSVFQAEPAVAKRAA